jgi:hypothetical protein
MKNLILLTTIAAAFNTNTFASEALVCDLLGESHAIRVSTSKTPETSGSNAMIDITVDIDASMLGQDWLEILKSQKGRLDQVLRVTINIKGIDNPDSAVSVIAPALTHPTDVLILHENKLTAEWVFKTLKKTRDIQAAMVDLDRISQNAITLLHRLGVTAKFKGFDTLYLTNKNKDNTASKVQALQMLLKTGLELVGDVVYPKGCEPNQKPQNTLKSLFRGKRSASFCTA